LGEGHIMKDLVLKNSARTDFIGWNWEEVTGCQHGEAW
jgi:hypothetical protein